MHGLFMACSRITTLECFHVCLELASILASSSRLWLAKAKQCKLFPTSFPLSLSFWVACLIENQTILFVGLPMTWSEPDGVSTWTRQRWRRTWRPQRKRFVLRASSRIRSQVLSRWWPKPRKWTCPSLSVCIRQHQRRSCSSSGMACPPLRPPIYEWLRHRFVASIRHSVIVISRRLDRPSRLALYVRLRASCRLRNPLLDFVTRWSALRCANSASSSTRVSLATGYRHSQRQWPAHRSLPANASLCRPLQRIPLRMVPSTHPRYWHCNSFRSASSGRRLQRTLHRHCRCNRIHSSAAIHPSQRRCPWCRGSEGCGCLVRRTSFSTSCNDTLR